MTKVRFFDDVTIFRDRNITIPDKLIMMQFIRINSFFVRVQPWMFIDNELFRQVSLSASFSSHQKATLFSSFSFLPFNFRCYFLFLLMANIGFALGRKLMSFEPVVFVFFGSRRKFMPAVFIRQCFIIEGRFSIVWIRILFCLPKYHVYGAEMIYARHAFVGRKNSILLKFSSIWIF